MRRSYLLPALALLALGGCGEASAPEGRAGTVTARVYVDRDASASLTDADSLLANVGVSLTGPGGESRTATTDAEGEVVFADVEPGSYTLTVANAAPVPPGTALVTNPTPSAVVSYQGGDVTIDFRYVFFPGSISGRIYREDNDEAGFQLGEDTPGANLRVFLRRSVNGAAADTIQTVTTDAQGAYRFALVAPGTYFVEFEDTPTIEYPGGAMQSITVTPNSETIEGTSPVFTGSLVLTIAEARALPDGQQVAVEGNVTVRPNTFTSGTGGVNSEIWIQDATGGIAVFSVPSTSTYALGDRLEVIGTTGRFSGQEQLTSPTVRPIGTNAPVTPKAISVAQARSLEDDGELVTVTNLTITSVPTGTGTAYTVLAASSAGDTFQIRVATGTNIPRTAFTVGNRYNVTGILTQNGGNAQVKPRGVSDIALGQAVTPIATARGIDSSSTQTITVVGTVTVPPGRFTTSSGFVNSEMWIQDATSGIAVFPVPTADSVNIRMGDVVEVTGRVKLNAQQEQIGNFNFIPTVTRLRAGTEITPIVLTGAQARSLADEGELITVQQFTVTAVGGGTGANFNVDGTAADGSVIQLRINGSATGVTGTGLTRSNFTVGNTYSVTGILSVFNTTVQIKPRQRSDINP